MSGIEAILRATGFPGDFPSAHFHFQMPCGDFPTAHFHLQMPCGEVPSVHFHLQMPCGDFPTAYIFLQMPCGDVPSAHFHLQVPCGDVLTGHFLLQRIGEDVLTESAAYFLIKRTGVSMLPPASRTKSTYRPLASREISTPEVVSVWSTVRPCTSAMRTW